MHDTPTSRPIAAGAHRSVANVDERIARLFPDEDGASVRRGGRRRLVVVLIAVVALLAIVGASTVAFADSGSAYRTTTATTQDVSSELHAVGTLEPVRQAQVAFPIEGTVASVDVVVGQQVTAGETLAELDLDELEGDLHDKQADLADAELTLDKARNGESVGGTESGPSGSADRPASYTTASGAALSTAVYTGGTSFQTVASTDEIRHAQQAVLDAQRSVDAALAVADTALDNATLLCEAVDDPTTVAACQTALQEVLTAQQAVKSAQDALAEASNTLDGLLAEQADSGGPSTPTMPDDSSSAPSTGSSPSGSVPSSGGSATGSTSPSSADLIAYQKAVDAAAAEVAVAEQAIEQAKISSPIDGTVIKIGFRVGADVTAGDTSTSIMVEGEGGVEATTLVSVEDVSKISVGQPATVSPDGQDARLTGKVTGISAAPVESGTTTNYLVTIGLDDPSVDVGNGSTGSIAIQTGDVRSALSVPTSAVSVSGGISTVTVLNGSSTTSVTVGTGVVGDTWTEITSGLEESDVVVLANLDDPLPSSATDSSSSTNGAATQGFRGGGGGFTFPGGGRGSGGFAPPGN